MDGGQIQIAPGADELQQAAKQSSPREMPAEIITAIAHVMAEMSTVGEDSTNAFAKYSYASIDAFFRQTRPACARAGLVILPRQLGPAEVVELKNAQGKGSHCLKFTFGFTLAAGGQSWSDPSDQMQVVLAYTGAQTTGAARSYAQKYWMRSLFQIATGEPDGDESPALFDPEMQAASPAQKRAAAPKPSVGEVQLMMSGGEIHNIALDKLIDTVIPFLKGLDPSQRYAWRERNEASLNRLFTLDKRLHLVVKTAVEGDD